MVPEELGDFLLFKGFRDDVAFAMVTNNVSGEVFLDLSEEDLKELIPIVGDRITVRKLIKELCEV